MAATVMGDAAGSENAIHVGQTLYIPRGSQRRLRKERTPWPTSAVSFRRPAAKS